jgi:hypothetical protein
MNRTSIVRKSGKSCESQDLQSFRSDGIGKVATRIALSIFSGLLLLCGSVEAQSKRLWVLRAPGEMTEYDPANFETKPTVKVPAEAIASPERLSVNHAGQMLFVLAVSLPLDEDDAAGKNKVWLWDGSHATTLERDVARTTGISGSNLAITESASVPYLAADGTHLYWFSNQAHRLQRDGVDLSTKNNWRAWRTDLTGAQHEDLTSVSLPDCSCPTGGCEETCPYSEPWVPDNTLGEFVLVTQVIAGKDQPAYKSTTLFEDTAGTWRGTAISPPMHRMLDAMGLGAILEAVPDTGCCGSSNQSDDQTLLRLPIKTVTVFDERSEYENPDYDVSFYTESGKLSPGLDAVAFTIAATEEANKPIQLAKDGQADPQESQRIHRALLELPAVEVKSVDTKGGSNSPQRVAFLPHATLVGWISDKEILVVEDHWLVGYNLTTGKRRKSNIRVQDAANVFLR